MWGLGVRVRVYVRVGTTVSSIWRSPGVFTDFRLTLFWGPSEMDATR